MVCQFCWQGNLRHRTKYALSNFESIHLLYISLELVKYSTCDHSLIKFEMQGHMLNRKSKCTTKKLLTTITGAKLDESEFDSVDAPLEPQTWEGRFLCGLLKSQPHIFLVAAAKQLQQMSIERKDTLTRWEHSIGSSEDCLHRLVISACPFWTYLVAGSQPLKSFNMLL